jgi:hypothetical protein
MNPDWLVVGLALVVVGFAVYWSADLFSLTADRPPLRVRLLSATGVVFILAGIALATAWAWIQP